VLYKSTTAAALLLLQRAENVTISLRRRDYEAESAYADVDRASFTWWVTIVQFICFIVTMSVYGVATYGGFTTTIRGEVCIQSVRYFTFEFLSQKLTDINNNLYAKF